MALPLVLHQPCIRVEVKSIAHHLCGHWRGMLAVFVSASALILRPESMHHKSDVPSRAALVRRAGVRSAEIRCP
jgi:hypothetical protein